MTARREQTVLRQTRAEKAQLRADSIAWAQRERPDLPPSQAQSEYLRHLIEGARASSARPSPVAL